jgi:hypothetical protein
LFLSLIPITSCTSCQKQTDCFKNPEISISAVGAFDKYDTADIYVDGDLVYSIRDMKYNHDSSASFRLPTGAHVVKVTVDGFIPIERTIKVIIVIIFWFF